MDLTKRNISDEHISVLHLNDPNTGEPMFADGDASKPLEIDLMHTEAPEYRKRQRKLLNKNIKAISRAVQADEDPQGAGERAAIEQHALSMVNWRNIGLGEDATPCTFENAVRLLEECPWVFPQVAGRLKDRSRFTKPSPAA